ncbi:DUF5803 family protein [Haloarchaeobius sp. HRN-SO-5]|uniref:DUF5803 family protein n=1 Tax=Haloarchaeobius sp. HRN-SO-5 TaxID=3446118 RepID=UPI003EBAB695
MNRRLALGFGLLVLLVASAGCLGFFDDSISDEALDEEATYGWDEVPNWTVENGTPTPVETNETTDVFVNVTGSSYHAVYHINNSSRDEFEVWTRGISNDNPVDISALRWRYPNGTTVNGSELQVYKTNFRTHIVFPDVGDGETVNGTLAFTGPTEPKTFRLWNHMEGSYEVVLPAGFRTEFFLFGQVVPAPDEKYVDDDNRVHLQWDEVTSTITVKYYLERDYYIFTGAFALFSLVAIGGTAYYWSRIRELTELREELGTGPDGGNGPPGEG